MFLNLASEAPSPAAAALDHPGSGKVKEANIHFP
jgi:hypothetical protein